MRALEEVTGCFRGDGNETLSLSLISEVRSAITAKSESIRMQCLLLNS